jgi:hypothetical protein
MSAGGDAGLKRHGPYPAPIDFPLQLRDGVMIITIAARSATASHRIAGTSPASLGINIGLRLILKS